MKIKFHKYQATGNDFVLIDNRTDTFSRLNNAEIAQLCDRKFGVGADGMILIEESKTVDFVMKYFNADGDIGSFCGNGSRAAVSFAVKLGMLAKKGKFEAFDGIHQTEITDESIKIKMADVQNGRTILDGTFIDTGSPHYVEVCKNVAQLDVTNKGRSLRYHQAFQPNGSNINFVEITDHDSIHVRTFERGVEDETLSCGTGVTAAAMVTAEGNGKHYVKVETRGGHLQVSFERQDEQNHNIWLEGPALMTFEGEITL